MTDIKQLQQLTDFDNLLDYLRDELDWPIEVEDADDAVYEYDADELGIQDQYAAKIQNIRQFRPLIDDQVWGIFHIEFDSNRLPIMALRRILQSLAVSRRHRDASLPAWQREDLLFICVYTSASEDKSGQRGVTFAHFRKNADGKDELRTFSWDNHETHFYYLRNLNLEKLRWVADTDDSDAWREQWRGAFVSRARIVIHESKQLASEMAKQAQFMRDAIVETYTLEKENGTWHKLKTRLEIELVNEELNATTFADVIAQTITYGLFSAAEQNPDFTLSDLVGSIPRTNPFLRDLLKTLVNEKNIDLIELGIDRLIALYKDADVPEIAQQFMRRTASGKEDPVILFYEQFLNEYDRKQRVDRGVFYTPDPVVSYIVRSVDAILKDEFGIKDGLASAEKHDNGEHRVQILDPATGTGTFLAHIIDLVHDAKAGMSKADWNDYVADDLLPRLNGFELMMAPYAIAHMKLGLKLEQTGYEFKSDQRLRVFLTNALEAPIEFGEQLESDDKFEQDKYVGGDSGSDFLSQEANEAAQVKKQKKIMVVIGNPPYSGHSANKGEYIHNLMRGKLPNGKKVANYFEVDGKPLNESNTKWLNDDYVKFIRIGQQRIEETGHGILAFITNNSYLDNPTFRGMRQSLMETFDTMYLLDLHGNTRKNETTPDNTKDANVFDIMQGVSIGLFIKGGENKGISKKDVWGLRDKKYKILSQTIATFDHADMLDVLPSFYLFVQQNIAMKNEYQTGWKITEILPENSLGCLTKRDRLVIDFEAKELVDKIQSFVDSPSDQKAVELFNLRLQDKDMWNAATARKSLEGVNLNDFVRIESFRPFDKRFIFYHEKYIARLNKRVMHNFDQDNLGFVTVRQLASLPFDHMWVTNDISDQHLISVRTKEGGVVLPIYLYPEKQKELFDTSEWELSEKDRRPNFSKAFVDTYARKLNLDFVTDGRGDLQSSFGPEDIFHYAYAVFHSPTYRMRYAEFLKIDFPRLPLTNDLALFRKLVQLGTDLVALHLLEDNYAGTTWGADTPLAKPITQFVEGENKTQVGKSSKSKVYNEKKKRIYIDTDIIKDGSYFQFNDDISEEEALATYEFQIGGYQVLHKWLYDRRETPSQTGRTLTDEDITHYQRVVVALHETRRLMAEIDEVIEDHGGFPIVGSQE